MRLPPNNLRRRFLRLALAVLSLGLPLVASAQTVNPTKATGAQKPMEGTAVWYPVPQNSLARRRAGKELTAAHNRLAIGTKVRVTHLGNGKNVVVHITDRGIFTRGAVIDLCKEAAEKLDMIREGSARVRLEILPDEKLPASKKPKTPPW